MKNENLDKITTHERQFTFSTLTGKFSLDEKTVDLIGQICRAGGYAGIEGCKPLVDSADPSKQDQLLKAFSEQSIQVHSFYLPFRDYIGNDIASLYETERLAAVECARTWIDVALTMGASVGIIHPTTRKGFDVGLEGFDRIWDSLRRSLETLGAYCQEHGFKLAVENLPGHGVERFGSRPEHFIRMREDLPNESIGFCLDTGHALLTEPDNPLAFMDAMGSRLIAFHLADNEGDRDAHLAPGNGKFPWAQLKEKLDHSSFQGPLCIETPPVVSTPPLSMERIEAPRTAVSEPSFCIEDWVSMLNQTRSLLA